MKTRSNRLTPHDIENAMVNPVLVFDRPTEIVTCTQLSREQKIEMLKKWELDARALQRASDESMTGCETSELDDVNSALSKLDPDNAAADGFGKAPTKI